jgi:hypothetical protein
VASKKFIKFLRKSLKGFGLNLKRKVCFKKSFKKKRKKETYLLNFRPSWPAGPTSLSRSSPPNRPPFLFPADVDIWALPVSLTPSPSFSSSSPLLSPIRRRRDPRRARPPLRLPFLSPWPIKAIKPSPLILLVRYSPLP